MKTEELKELMYQCFLGMGAQSQWNLSIEEFAITSVSLINFFSTTKRIPDYQKKEAAKELCNNYNMGLDIPMDELTLNKFADAIIQDKGMDMSKIRYIVDNIDDILKRNK